MIRPTAEVLRAAAEEGKILLASTSPRRRELMARAGFRFRVAQPCFDEAALFKALDGARARAAFDAALRATLRAAVRGKWASLGPVPGRLVLCFDTVVHDGQKAYGKPSGLAAARRMLLSLSGKEHCVTTACLVAWGRWRLVRLYTTRVVFRKLTPVDCGRALRLEHALDAAGAYKVQGAGLSYVRAIRGDYHNIVGLPLPFLTWLREGCP